MNALTAMPEAMVAMRDRVFVQSVPCMIKYDMSTPQKWLTRKAKMARDPAIMAHVRESMCFWLVKEGRTVCLSKRVTAPKVKSMGAESSRAAPEPRAEDVTLARRCIDGICSTVHAAGLAKDAAGPLMQSAAAVARGDVKGAAWAAGTGAAAVMDSKYHWDELRTEVALARQMIDEVRRQLAEATKSVQPCSAGAVRGAIDLYDKFITSLESGTFKKNIKETAFLSAWPLWYREELQRHHVRLTSALQVMQSDLAIAASMHAALSSPNVPKAEKDRIRGILRHRCPA